MSKKIRTIAPGLSFSRNKKGEIIWQIGGKNGRQIGGSTPESFTRIRGAKNNLAALRKVFGQLDAAIYKAEKQFKAKKAKK